MTENLKIEIKHLLKSPQYVNIDLQPSELDLEDTDFRFNSPVTGNITFTFANERVIAKGNIHTKVQTQCVRCLGKATVDINAKVDALYENDKELLNNQNIVTNHEEQVRTYYDGEAIYPANELREAIMLELPQLPLCSPDCKGLCPSCGINLNTISCDCEQANNDDTNAFKEALKNIKLK